MRREVALVRRVSEGGGGKVGELGEVCDEKGSIIIVERERERETERDREMRGR